jgi:trans-2,3-dihydro-3-hydroxyanthranilate isomerase
MMRGRRLASCGFEDMRRRFVTLDVFTGRRFAGNPLAVVLEPAGLDTDSMQAVAREFNLSETVFVLPPDAAANRAKLRIFTPTRELPFAGHPTVGTAVLLARIDGRAHGEIVLEEGVGPVRCRVESRGEGRGFARFDVPKPPEQVGEGLDSRTVAAALGLEPDEIGFDGAAPARWSAGNPFVFVPLRSLETIGRSRPDLTRWDAAFGRDGAFLFCRQTAEAGNAFHARMFAPHHGVAEDPATGSAAAAFAGLVALHGGLGDGDHALRLEQGYEMGRPSLITLFVTMRAGGLEAASIGGEAIAVSEGTIEA